MKTTNGSTRRLRTLLALIFFAAAAHAALPKMPGKYYLPRGAKSPGQVAFNHLTHVLDDEPNCVTCHPRHFSMLNPSRATGLEVITHEAMDKGQACGACHGKSAFKFANHCDSCHGN
jgi:c(7)-type cytochrome triheme protein